MATIEKRIGKSGKVSYRITVAGGIDSTGKQIRTRRTWEPPKPGMTEKQIEKSLSRAVSDFEREIEQGYRLDHKQTFAEYAKYVLDLKERTGTKPRTIERYQSLLERVNKAIGHLKLTDIRPQHLNTFYQNLGEEGIRNGATKAVAHIDIRAWIKNNGTSITKLAAKAGTATATLSAAINGEKISGEKAAAISSAMGLRTEAVFSLERDTTPLSSKTILEHHRIISSVLAQAEKEMLIQFNPASKATPPKVQRKAPDYYQPETISQILDALVNAPLKWRAATYLLIDTGCRRGEAMGLKWESLDLAGGIMTIERALLYSPKKGVYESTPKTGKSRVLKLAPETLQLLGKWKTAQEELRNGYADAWIDTGYVFTQDNGDRMNPDSLTDWLNKFSKANALPHIHPHAFRHTAASTMIANGVDIVTAANELGHASATTTATIYAHQIAEAKARAEDVRAGVFKRQ